MSSLRNSPHKRSFQQFNSSQSSAWKSLRVQLVPPPVLEETCEVHVKKYITKVPRWEERPGSWMVEKLRNLALLPYSCMWLPCRKGRLWIERDCVNNDLLDLSFCNWSVLPLYRQDKIAKMHCSAWYYHGLKISGSQWKPWNHFLLFSQIFK